MKKELLLCQDVRTLIIYPLKKGGQSLFKMREREREVQNVLQTGVQFFLLLYGGFHTIDNRLLRTQNVVLVDSC